MNNAFVADAEFLKTQADANQRLQDKYMSGELAQGRKFHLDQLQEPVLWAKSPMDVLTIIKSLQMDDAFNIDFLSDITAYDNVDKKDGDKRFVLVYQLFSTTKFIRIRLKCAVAEGEEAISITPLWNGANWLEREVYDMYGIRFKNHPNMRRIMMDERFSGFPLRKEYPMKQREPFADNVRLHLGPHPLPPIQKD